MKVNFIILFLMVSYLFLHSCSLDNMGFDIESDSEEVIVDTKSTDFSYLFQCSGAKTEGLCFIP